MPEGEPPPVWTGGAFRLRRDMRIIGIVAYAACPAAYPSIRFRTTDLQLLTSAQMVST